MAERRMFAKSVIDTDAFLDMPLSAQALYFHLCMRADDDGFVANPKKIQRLISCSDDDLKLLVAKRYLLVFDSGIIVIKHWRLHNYIRKDTYTQTLYQEEKSTLYLKADGAYTDNPTSVLPPVTVPSQVRDGSVDGALTQVSIGKDRLGKVSIEDSRRFTPPSVEKVKTYCEERRNGIDPQSFIDFYESKGWMVGSNHMKDWKAAVRTWESHERRPQGGRHTGNNQQTAGEDAAGDWNLDGITNL